MLYGGSDEGRLQRLKIENLLQRHWSIYPRSDHLAGILVLEVDNDLHPIKTTYEVHWDFLCWRECIAGGDAYAPKSSQSNLCITLHCFWVPRLCNVELSAKEFLDLGAIAMRNRHYKRILNLLCRLLQMTSCCWTFWKIPVSKAKEIGWKPCFKSRK